MNLSPCSLLSITNLAYGQSRLPLASPRRYLSHELLELFEPSESATFFLNFICTHILIALLCTIIDSTHHAARSVQSPVVGRPAKHHGEGGRSADFTSPSLEKTAGTSTADTGSADCSVSLHCVPWKSLACLQMKSVFSRWRIAHLFALLVRSDPRLTKLSRLKY